MYEIIGAFLPVIIYLFILIIILKGQRHTRETYKLMKEMNDVVIDKIKHIYLLTNILAEGLCSPMHKQMFHKAFEDGPEATSKNIYNSFEDVKKILFENYSKGRENLLKEKEKFKGNPIIEKKFQDHINELENVLNLLSSVDDKTSNEHLQTVMNEINLSVMKLSKSYKDLK